jgi:oligopeptide/dipeptide ABC transporter ATP-binding protein
MSAMAQPLPAEDHPHPAPEPAGDPILSIEDLKTTVRARGERFDIVRGVSLDVFENEVVCLVGESGCGKSITALSVMQLLPTPPVHITGGRVVFRDQNLLELAPKAMRAVRSDNISMIFQDPLTSLDPVFTIGHLISEVIRAHRDVDKKTAHQMSVDILNEVGIPAPEQRVRSFPHELSGGMRQRVMIALALVLDPEILIADEPTTALDVTVQAQILEKLIEEQQGRRMSMLLITHDLAVVDRVAVMYAGEIVEQAPVDQLFDEPQHPYTQGLLGALPHVSQKREALHPIPGLVPPPQMMPTGCHFAPRCSYAVPTCWTDHPALESSGERALRCFNPQPYEG